MLRTISSLQHQRRLEQQRVGDNPLSFTWMRHSSHIFATWPKIRFQTRNLVCPCRKTMISKLLLVALFTLQLGESSAGCHITLNVTKSDVPDEYQGIVWPVITQAIACMKKLEEGTSRRSNLRMLSCPEYCDLYCDDFSNIEFCEMWCIPFGCGRLLTDNTDNTDTCEFPEVAELDDKRSACIYDAIRKELGISADVFEAMRDDVEDALINIHTSISLCNCRDDL